MSDWKEHITRRTKNKWGRKRDETQERRQIEKQEQTLFPIIAKKETKLFNKEVFLLNTFRFPGTNDNITKF